MFIYNLIYNNIMPLIAIKTKETLERLRNVKIHPRETDCQVIERLLDNFENGKK